MAMNNNRNNFNKFTTYSEKTTPNMCSPFNGSSKLKLIIAL